MIFLDAVLGCFCVGERFEAVSRTLTLVVFDGKFLTDVFIGLGRACNIFRLGKHK